MGETTTGETEEYIQELYKKNENRANETQKEENPTWTDMPLEYMSPRKLEDLLLENRRLKAQIDDLERFIRQRFQPLTKAKFLESLNYSEDD
jgi:hypothetical protein